MIHAKLSSQDSLSIDVPYNIQSNREIKEKIDLTPVSEPPSESDFDYDGGETSSDRSNESSV